MALRMVRPPPGGGAVVVLTANVDRHFRWKDEEKPGFTAGTFDSIPNQLEPVVRFEPNAITLAVE